MARADVCFHLAAAVGVQLIVDKPLESLATNIRGSEIVFEKAHKHGTKVLVTSTSEIYGKNTSDRLGEEDDRIIGSPLKSRWSYSEAKAIEEILAYTYWRQKNLPTVIVRLFNTVGPRQTGHYGRSPWKSWPAASWTSSAPPARSASCRPTRHTRRVSRTCSAASRTRLGPAN
jgi:UDP-glucose 4-epimerase